MQKLLTETHLDSVAGVDTTSTTLAYLFWELSRRSDVMNKLQAEIDEAMPDNRSIPDIGTLYKLPYLTGFIKEGDSLSSKNPPSPLTRFFFDRSQDLWSGPKSA